MQDGFTALHRTCVTGKTQVIKLLLENGANVNAEDMYGDSPLHYACFCGHKDAIELLLAYGADPKMASRDGKTPIDSAREEKHEHLFPVLDKYAPDASRLKPSPPSAPPSMSIGKSSGKGNKDFGLGPNSSTIIGGTGQTGTVAGLDFSRGVIIEGELQKKRANKVLAWRKKYYVMSSTYGSMFFWTGTREHQEGVIKKVRFETFYKVVHHKDKKDGRRFDLKVVTGRTMSLLANSPEEANAWVDTIRRELGQFMGVLKIQAAIRRYLAMKKLSDIRKQRKAAVDKIISTKANLPEGLRPDRDGVVIEGPLKKKNHSSVSSLLGAWRLRYFVLNINEAQLYYYETKAKRNAGFLPRSIPILSFFSVRKVDEPKQKTNGRRFSLKVSSGRIYEFESPSAKTTDQWVTALQAVLPRDHIAVIRIQSTYRMFRAKKLRKQLQEKKKDILKSISDSTGCSENEVISSVTKIQATFRMYRHRSKFLKQLNARRAEEERLKEVKNRRLWLKRSRRIEAAGGSTQNGSPEGNSSPIQTGTKSRLARLKKLKEKRGNAIVPIVDEKGIAWTVQKDEEQQQYYASSDGQTSWEAPNNTVGTDYYPYYQTSDSETGEHFFVNAFDDETSWDAPPGWRAHVEICEENARKAARDGTGDYHWTSEEDTNSGATYYVNSVSGRRQWDKPPGWDTYIEELKQSATGGWVQVDDPTTGKPYWYNPETGERRFEEVKESGVVDDDVDSDDDDAVVGKEEENEWKEHVDEETGRKYFYNPNTGESRWAGDDEKEETNLDPHEVYTFSCYINTKLEDRHTDLPQLPIDTEAEFPAIIEALRNGVVLTYLMNAIHPDSVDERVLDRSAVPAATSSDAASARPAKENIQLALSAAASYGASFHSKDVSTVADQIENGDGPTILEVVWKFWMLDLQESLNVRKKSALLALANQQESAKDMISLSPEQLLQRWVNYHISQSPFDTERISKIGEIDLAKATAVLRHAAPEYCRDLPATRQEADQLKDSHDDEKLEELANNVLAAGFGAGVPAWFTSGTFIPPNDRLIFAFFTCLLDASPGLETESKKARARSASSRGTQMCADVDSLKAELNDIEDDQSVAGSKELRTFTTWINSLGIKGVHVNNLVADFSDGVMPLRVINHVEEGIVNWRKVNKRPKSRFQKVENCNYLISMGQAMDFHLVNAGGLDFVDGNAKIVHGFVWQLMRHHTLKLLSQIAFDLFGAEEAKEADILRWANGIVRQATNDQSLIVKSFKDPKLSSSMYLLTLLNQVRPIIDWNLVTEGRTEEEQERNAKYLISAARKMGAIVFCTWDDIVEVNSRMIMLFVAAVMVIYNQVHNADDSQ